MKARQVSEFVRMFQQYQAAAEDPERLLADLTDEQLTTILQVVAGTFTQLKREAMRRGIWDDLVNAGLKMKKSELVG